MAIQAEKKLLSLFFRPDFKLYKSCSRAFKDVCKFYSPTMEEFSVDEYFLDMTGIVNDYSQAVNIAHEIKDRIKNELDFMVNVGVGENKLFMCVSEIYCMFERCRSTVYFKPYLHNIFETLKYIGILERHVPKNVKNVKLNIKKSKAVKICFFMAFLFYQNSLINGQCF